ncbi:glycoside hydrolase family 65 protein [Streptomyces sp. NPDC001914]|uniref:glycoside hydrolase family 65 protein n=1 Tax=Streptomyces sp. NPDC001914 TaxID=3364623 RepID=UPI00369F4699
MIVDDSYTVEPWALSETSLDLATLPQSESVFALSNGHVGWRGNLDEGEPHGLPGTYLNGCFEFHPLPYAEGGYGYPESGQSVINVTNGKTVRLLVNDEPFDLRNGHLHSHQRRLDLRSGLLHRTTTWTSPAGCTVKVRSTRMVSFTQRTIAAVSYEVQAVDTPVRIVLQSELVANEALPTSSGDPRAAAVLASPLEAEEDEAQDTRLRLIHCTRGSRLRVAAAAEHVVQGPHEPRVTSESSADVARLTVISTLAQGESLQLQKFIAYGWSGTRSLPAVRDQVEAALAAAKATGWQGLVDEQRRYLNTFWARADVEVEGDTQVQQAVRFALFHVLQAGARAEQCSIPAKGLTGTGYDGHSFWDTETFVLPLLTYTSPSAVAEALRWRHATLPTARTRARELGLRGAAFPWRTIDGAECSAYWPAGTAAFHVNADIACAVMRYVSATDDEEFERSTGIDLLVETARLWVSLGRRDNRGAFHIDGVTGPDEYSAVTDDNIYTNLMAGENLRGAADACERHPGRAAELGVDIREMATWRDLAVRVYMPYSDELQVHEQNAGFTSRQRWDFESTSPEQYPLLLHFPYFDIYRKQVVKQADLVLAMYTCSDAFTAEQKKRNFAYYEGLTVRDSSLSACCQAVMAAETGHLQLAYDYAVEAALMDLNDLERNTKDGLHIASLAGAWMALVCGFGGMRHAGHSLSFAPRLPDALKKLTFHMQIFDRRLRVEVYPNHSVYTLLKGARMTLRHYGVEFEITDSASVLQPIPSESPGRAPAQPLWRRAAERSAAAAPSHAGGRSATAMQQQGP